MNAPSCEKCRFYIPGRYAHTGQCRRFIAYRGRGRVVHEFTDSARLDKSKCGPDGKLFVPVQQKKEWGERHEILKSLYHDDE